MTDEAVIRWVHENFKVGSVIKRNVKGLNKSGKKYKTQWRWRCTFREAYYVCRLIWPYAQVKLHKVEQIIDHYSPDHVFDEKVVSLQQYREAMEFRMTDKKQEISLWCIYMGTMYSSFKNFRRFS